MLGAAQCRILTEVDIKAITGVPVRAVDVGPGRCGNYETLDGRAFLGVSALATRTEYVTTMDAIFPGAYPRMDMLTGVGDGGLLFTDSGPVPIPLLLLARKGESGILLFPRTRAMSAAQLKALAVIGLAVLSRRQ